MSRRNGGRNRRAPPARSLDPFASLGALYAWRANDAVDNGSVTTSIPNYIGATKTLPRQGSAGQAIKAASANLGGQLAITMSGPGEGYGNVSLWGAAPTDVTIVSVARIAATTVGLSSITVAGAVNSGMSQLDIAGTKSRKVATDASTAVTLPASVVWISVFTAEGISSYVNSKTAATAATAGALAGTMFHLGVLDSGTTFVFDGQWATTAIWNRALSAAEAALVLDRLGAKYGIAISP